MGREPTAERALMRINKRAREKKPLDDLIKQSAVDIVGPRLDPASQRLFPVALALGYRERGAKHRRAPGWAGRGEAQGLTRSRAVFLYLFLTSLRYLVYLSFFISNLISRSWTGVYPLRYTRQSSPSSICPPREYPHETSRNLSLTTGAATPPPKKHNALNTLAVSSNNSPNQPLPPSL